MTEPADGHSQSGEARAQTSPSDSALHCIHDTGLPQTRLYRLSSGTASLFSTERGQRPPKGKNESRQLEYLAQLSLQRRKEVCNCSLQLSSPLVFPQKTHHGHALQQLAADEEIERVSRMRQKARHAVARISSQNAPSRGEGAEDIVPSPHKTERATSRDMNRSSSTSRLPDSAPGSRGEAQQLPRYRKSTGTIREVHSDADRSKSTSPEKARISQLPTSERPKGYRSHTERLQSFIREQQRKHPLEMISSGAVTNEDRKQRYVPTIMTHNYPQTTLAACSFGYQSHFIAERYTMQTQTSSD